MTTPRILAILAAITFAVDLAGGSVLGIRLTPLGLCLLALAHAA